MTYAEALKRAVAKLGDIDNPARDARWLLAFSANVGRDRITLLQNETLDEDVRSRFFALVQERAARRPTSHLIGGREFFGRWFKVTPDVLDPRPETEILVAEALRAPFTRVLDLGTGSGAILVTLLAERQNARGVGTDISERGILVAGENAAAHGVTDRILLPLSEWWDDVGGRYDLIVSNPPYIAADEMPDLSPEVREYEPHQALTDGGDGLSAFRAIAGGLKNHLLENGRVLLEIGPAQALAVSEILRAAGLGDIQVHQDLDGRDRVIDARIPA